MICGFLKKIGVLAVAGTFVACGEPAADRRGSHTATILAQGFALSDLELGGSEATLTQQVQGVNGLQIEVKDCLSGYHFVTAAAEKIKLYKHDQKCKVALHGFQWNGDTYRPSHQPLTGPEGTMAWFRSQKKEVPVVISSMISSPLKEDDEISYSISSRIIEGPQKSVLGMKVGESQRIQRHTGSLHSPFFYVKRSKIIAMIPDTKSFGVRFDLECIDNIKHETNPNMRKCKNVKLKNLSYQLVEDRYFGHPTLEQMDVLFRHGAIAVDPDYDYQPSGASFHGGFSTSAGPIILRTPTDTARHPNMILILKSLRGYQYFNIDILTGN